MENETTASPRVPLLQRLRSDGEFSDCIISVGNEEFAVHYNIVSCLAPFFKTALHGDFKEASTKRISIGDTTPQAASVLLDFAYEVGYVNKIATDMSLALDVCELAHRYEIKPLFEQCVDVVVKNVTCDNALQVLQKLRMYECAPEVVERVVLFVAQNFHSCFYGDSNNEVGELSCEEMLHFIQSEESIVDEYTRLDAILLWRFIGNAKSRSLGDSLLEEIRFELMDAEEMERMFDIHQVNLPDDILRKMVGVRSRSAVNIPVVSRWQLTGQKDPRKSCIYRLFSIPFHRGRCIDGKDNPEENSIFFKFGHWVMSVLFDVNEERQVRIRLKCERRHARRSEDAGWVPTLKEELESYKLDIDFVIASNGNESTTTINNTSTSIRNLDLKETISFTTCTSISDLLTERDMQAVFTLSAFKSTDDDVVSDTENTAAMKQLHSDFEMLGYL